jgi:hypothetical protein
MQRSLVVTVLVLLAAALGSADTLTFVGAGSNQIDGAFAYPYDVELNGGAAVAMMCDDFSDHIEPNETWDVFANTLTQGNVAAFIYGADASFGADGLGVTPSSAWQAYQEAGYVFTGMAEGTIDPSEGNAAVWYLFSPGALGADATAGVILDNAYAFVSSNPSYDFSYITVYSPDPSDPKKWPVNGNNYPQEFLSMTGNVPYSVTPEPPASVLLLAGAALIGLVGLVRRKRLSATAL